MKNWMIVLNFKIRSPSSYRFYDVIFLFFLSVKYSKTVNQSIWERTTLPHENVRKYQKDGPMKIITIHYINLGWCLSAHSDLIWKEKQLGRKSTKLGTGVPLILQEKNDWQNALQLLATMDLVPQWSKLK